MVLIKTRYCVLQGPFKSEAALLLEVSSLMIVSRFQRKSKCRILRHYVPHTAGALQERGGAAAGGVSCGVQRPAAGGAAGGAGGGGGAAGGAAPGGSRRNIWRRQPAGRQGLGRQQAAAGTALDTGSWDFRYDCCSGGAFLRLPCSGPVSRNTANMRNYDQPETVQSPLTAGRLGGAAGRAAAGQNGDAGGQAGGAAARALRRDLRAAGARRPDRAARQSRRGAAVGAATAAQGLKEATREPLSFSSLCPPGTVLRIGTMHVVFHAVWCHSS